MEKAVGVIGNVGNIINRDGGDGGDGRREAVRAQYACYAYSECKYCVGHLDSSWQKMLEENLCSQGMVEW